MQQIDDILALTDQVQQCVDEGRWVEARALEKDRLALLTDLFAGDDVATNGPECQKLARDLLARNARMTETVRVHRGDLDETTRRVNLAAGAVSAYRRNEPALQWGEAISISPVHRLSE